ncbi:MAG: patatin-like phospholipase family protein [Thiotrichales bacterium]|nr:MAG: patatin-like phospholipase family protein [Thiotrichales bacterium]
MDTTEKTVSLILGSGGARGLAHVGIIQWLERNGYDIQSISGCSMGALVGGVYAAGKLDIFTEWVRAITRTDMLKLLDISFGASGMVKGEKIINTLKELVGDQLIEELPMTYTAVASDIVNEKEVWLNDGPLFDAIRASISLPFFFTPASYNGVELLDGGILNPVPIAPTFSDNTAIKLAVNLGGPVDKQLATTGHAETHVEAEPDLMDRISRFVDTIQGAGDDLADGKLGMLEIADQSFDAMQGAIARSKLAAYPPDVIIEFPRNLCGTLEFDRAEEMIEIGYNQAAVILG